MNISVIIPTYNRAKQVEQAVRSVLAQSVRATEIIVVDDGSEDDTAALIEASFGNSVKLLSQQNNGVSAARNLGIAAAQGDWIAFLDSDDLWLPEKLAEQSALLASRPEIKVCHTDEIWIRDGVRVNPMRKHRKPEGFIYLECLPLCCVSPSSMVIHRSVFDAVGLFDCELPACEDYDLWLRIFSRYEAGLIDTPLLQKFGGHADQLSRKHWGMDRFRVRALSKMLETDWLSSLQRLATIKMLVKKCHILIKGCVKHGKQVEADNYRQLQQQWSDQLPQQSDCG